jgi:hypothetical protein
MGKIRTNLVFGNPRFEIRGLCDVDLEAARRMAELYSVRLDETGYQVGPAERKGFSSTNRPGRIESLLHSAMYTRLVLSELVFFFCHRRRRLEISIA